MTHWAFAPTLAPRTTRQEFPMLEDDEQIEGEEPEEEPETETPDPESDPEEEGTEEEEE